MNKTANTIVFVVVASIVSITITLILAFVPLILIGVIFNKILNEQGFEIIVGIIFMVVISGAFVGGFFIYNLLLNILLKKIDLSKYIHPILSGKRKPPRTD
jgi:membrane-anchored glycerophosphoryl diester phosphodiesterase (GDPDase)